jgi:hypothetical protein
MKKAAWEWLAGESACPTMRSSANREIGVPKGAPCAWF